MSVWLILCHATDQPALWAYGALKARGVEALELITAEVLACALRWEHRVCAGEVWFSVQLADGRTIDSREVRGTLNRIQDAPLVFWKSAAERDRDYVMQEIHAFYQSWLYALPSPVLNRCGPLGLSGAARQPEVWSVLAAQAGLPIKPYCRDSLSVGPSVTSSRGKLKRVIVVGSQTVPAAVPRKISDGCHALSEISATQLLGVDFEVDPTGAWTFAHATPWPELRGGGEHLLDALETALGMRRAKV